MLDDLSKIERLCILSREKERQFRLIAENTTDVITVVDPDFNFTYVSPSNEELSGYTPEQMKQLSIPELLTAESLEKIRKLKQGELKELKSHIRLELEHVHKDGTTFWVEELVNPMLDDDGGLIGYLTVSRDITERKLIEEELRKSEERFRLLAENAKAMIFRCSLPSGVIEYMNPACKQTLFPGPGGRKNVVSYLHRIIHPEWREWAQEKWRQFINGDAEGTIEYPIVSPTGETLWVAHTGVIVTDLSGNPIAADSVLTDITELKEKEKKLAELAEEKHNILIEINHRVKNNLATVEALAMIELSKSNKSKKESIEDIISRIKTINLIHEKLYTTENFSATNIADYLQELVKLLASYLTVTESNFQFRHDIEPLELPIKANTPLGIITAELLTNTFKHAHIKGEGKIYLSLRKDGDRIIYTYSDSGTDLRGRVHRFEDLPEGTGTLLLRELAKGLGGTITLNTEKCTEFTIVFPSP
jgi:PAS domain S-box-containing protein